MGAVDENAEAHAFIGKTLGGKYRVERVIGLGGMGFVVAATHLHIDEPVALKLLYRSFAADGEIVKRFMREAKAARKIRSEHVVRVLDVGTLESGAPYLVMEQLQGQDLEQILRRMGRQPVATALDVILQASEALAEAHVQNMVHRDLKPANLFVTKRPDGDALVKVLDFGISKVTGAGGSDLGQTKAGDALLGSPQYMAPEQLRSLKDVDARTDIWALGAMLYEMLTGSTPFNGMSLPELCSAILDKPPPPVRAVRPDVPPGLEAVILACLAKEREARPQDVAALAAALAPFAPPTVQASASRIGGVFRTARFPTTAAPSSAGPNAAVSPMAASQLGPTPSRPDPVPSRISTPPSTQNPRSGPPPAAMPGPPRPFVATTGKAWGKDRASAPPASAGAPPHLIATVVGALAMGVIGVLVVFVVLPYAQALRTAGRPPPSASVATEAPPTSATASPPTSSAAPTPPADPSSGPAEVASAALLAELVDAGPMTAASTAASAKPVPKVDCSKPFTVDAEGNKRWKRECF